MSNRDLKAIWIVFLSVVLIFLGGLYFFGLTSIGGRIVILWVLQKYIDPGKISIGHVRGDFIRGITFSEIILQNTKYLSVAHTVRLAQFNIRRIAKSFVDFEAEVQQGAVELPNSMPINFEGGYSRNIISARIQSLLIDINNLAHFLPKSLPRIESAKIVNLDLNLKGDVLNPDRKSVV